jgi:hypothetical protein
MKFNFNILSHPRLLHSQLPHLQLPHLRAATKPRYHRQTLFEPNNPGVPEINQPGGLSEISRGLSAAIPPEYAPIHYCTPKGC